MRTLFSTKKREQYSINSTIKIHLCVFYLTKKRESNALLDQLQKRSYPILKYKSGCALSLNAAEFNLALAKFAGEQLCMYS